MSKISIYLNFQNKTEEAFHFYETVFKSKISHITRFGDLPSAEGTTQMPEEVKKLIMHAELPLFNGYNLMSSDVPESFGYSVSQGNNIHIMLQPESREETKRLFDSLKIDGIVEQELKDMFWGDYYGSLTDKFGICWMFNYH